MPDRSGARAFGPTGIILSFGLLWGAVLVAMPAGLYTLDELIQAVSFVAMQGGNGLIVENGRRLFVSSGIGTSILPVRFLVPPEISILELQ